MEFILISPVEVIGYHLWTRKHRPVFREHDSEAVLDAFLYTVCRLRRSHQTARYLGRKYGGVSISIY